MLKSQRSQAFRANFLQKQDAAFMKTESPVQAEDFPYAFNYAAVTPFGAKPDAPTRSIS